MKKKGWEPEPAQPSSQEENNALTGYFNDGGKRIDIVYVFKDDGSDEVKNTRQNFLSNIIQFGLEAEVEQGTMLEHRDLIFVKIHAPDAIIEECGLYFCEKSFFKDSHLQFVNPILNIFGVSNERELIKTVRKQYPGPDNYSTLERSNIVYKILSQIPFGKYYNHFGINKLINNNIIQDAFALHDGPYFIEPKQSTVHINARQVLFIEWLGMVNVWKTQPIHMIHEYFGKRISYYFAFYEYFNFMLIFPGMFGIYTISLIFKNNDYGFYYKHIHEGYTWEANYTVVLPECRNVTLCPYLRLMAYEKELQFLSRIDKDETFEFGQFMSIWGIFFLMPWRYMERYLIWIWEETRKYTNELVRPEYEEHEMKIEKEKTAKNIKTTKNPGGGLRMFLYMLTAAFLGLWALFMFRFSIVIWHYPRWKRLKKITKDYINKIDEFEYIAMGAGIYTVIVYGIKMVFMALARKVTHYENNKTFLIHERSIALKLYPFSFIGTYMIFIMLTYLGALNLHIKKRGISEVYHYMFGYGMMNSGFGSTMDDIAITLAVITILEHVMFRMAGFLIKDKTDYPVGFDSRAPCWEREYQLKPITESFFHKRYNALVMQFALLTCYSMMFPLASLFLFIINIWDLRNAARQLLLEYRRPLLINTSGPGIWKYLILITALYAPMSNTAIVVEQSFTFASIYFESVGINYIDRFECTQKEIDLVEFNYEDFLALKSVVIILQVGPIFHFKCMTNRFVSDILQEIQLEMCVRFILLMTVLGVAIFLSLFYLLPGTSNSLEDAIKTERRIKYKYQTRRASLSY